MDPASIRNIAIIAHVDHGKTTLVDELFRQSGMFRENQEVAERLMDSMDLERERGITIASKNGSFQYAGTWVNIVDTPGHADFGGQVERVLRMANGALLLVDAQEGPMPQTHFVLRKALALELPIVVVINKIDKPNARPDWAVDQVFDLFVKLHAPDHILDFPIVYASAKEGTATLDLEAPGSDMKALFEVILSRLPAPCGDPDAPLQMLVSTIEYSPYLGRLGIGRISSGSLNVNDPIAVVLRDGDMVPARVTKVFRFVGNQRESVAQAGVGEIVAVAGTEEVTVGVTFTDPDDPRPLPPLDIDPPTMSVNVVPNDSPFAGEDGQFITPRHIAERLRQEALADVALQVESLGVGRGFKVSGRGELHLSILIERMRREGYEFQVTRPQAILVEQAGLTLEPFEEVTLDVPEDLVGVVIEKMGIRKGQLLTMETESGTARLVYRAPTRGLMGFRSEFLTDTRGMGVMNYVFSGYAPHAGEIRTRLRGVLVAMSSCTTVAYALFNLQDRGRLFYGPGARVYRGQIIGEHCRDNDLLVNPAKGKKLSNVRAAGSDESVILTPPTVMSLEECLTFVNDDELVEVTPRHIRLRKREVR